MWKYIYIYIYIFINIKENVSNWQNLLVDFKICSFVSQNTCEKHVFRINFAMTVLQK